MGILSNLAIPPFSRRARIAVLAAVGLVGCGSTSNGAAPLEAGVSESDAGDKTDGAADAGPTGSRPDGATVGGGVVDAEAGPAPITSWDPPFALGSPGWRSSTVPFCTNNSGGFLAYDIWSDSRGVFALAFASCNVLGNVACGNQGASLQFNDGTGWKAVYRSMTADELRLTGIDGGAAVLSGGACGITLVDPTSGQATCASVLPNLSGAAFGVSATSAYVWDGANLDHFDGANWSPFATLPFPISGFYADSHIAVAVGFGQAIALKADGASTFQALPNVPAGDYGSVWAFAANDIWAGNRAGQLVHYDGAAWQVFESGSADTTGDGVSQLWGSAGQLFFRTGSEFGRWSGTAAELLLTKNDRIVVSGIWGNSPTEVFVSLFDTNYMASSCEGLFALYYDGHAFHQF